MNLVSLINVIQYLSNPGINSRAIKSTHLEAMHTQMDSKPSGCSSVNHMRSYLASFWAILSVSALHSPVDETMNLRDLMQVLCGLLLLFCFLFSIFRYWKRWKICSPSSTQSCRQRGSSQFVKEAICQKGDNQSRNVCARMDIDQRGKNACVGKGKIRYEQILKGT